MKSHAQMTASGLLIPVIGDRRSAIRKNVGVSC